MTDVKISMVKRATDTQTRDVRLCEVLGAIRTGGQLLRRQIEKIRTRFEAELKKSRGDLQKAKLAIDPLKKSLPAVTLSGRFSYRASDKLVQHSGLFCADLDSLGRELERVRAKLKTSPHLWALFRSPTGIGLKAVFRVPADGAKHPGSYRAVEKHVRDLCAVQVDQKCKDPARLCFMSYDPQLYVNGNATEITPLPEPEKPKPVQLVGLELAPDLPLRERVATQELGPLKWSAEKGGFFCKCPGEACHTNSTGEKHTIVYLDRVPTLDCQHESCKKIVDAFNAKLRSEIGKGEYQARREAPRVDLRRGADSEPPEPPPPPVPYVPPPLALLPSVLQQYVHAAAESLNVDVAFILLPLLSSLATAIGNSRSILLKPGFVQPPVIWTAITQRSGYLKSPAIEAGCFAVMEQEHELMRENKKAQEIYENDLAEWKAKKKKAAEGGEAPSPPPFLTCVMDDLTIEAVSDVLAMNPRGVLVAKDEISHWFASFDQYRAHGKGSDVSRWLSLHTAVHFAQDRRTDRRHLRIRDPRANITGGIQPKVLGRVLTPDFFERGLPARFIFAFPSADQIRWSEATIPDDLRNAVLELFEKIWLLPPGHDKHGAARPDLLGLDKDAKAVYVPFYNECGEWAIAGDEKEEAAWNKLGGYAARFSLVGQVARNPEATIVTENVMAAACDLARWSGKESARIYGVLAETPQQREQRALIEFIRNRGAAVSVRDVTHGCWAYRQKPEEAERALNALCRNGFGKWVNPEAGGRGQPARKFQLLTGLTITTNPPEYEATTPNTGDGEEPNSQKNTPSGEREPAPEKEASLPVMITKRMEAELQAMGYSQADIGKMTPARANNILADKPVGAPGDGRPLVL